MGSPGYLVEVEPDGLDLARFEALARAGRGALVDGDPELAVDLLTEGLALWRGPALVDVNFASPDRRDALRLEELRLAAVGDRIDAELALGRHLSVIAELEGLSGEHPLRERHRAQLMLALYRSGRQGDALAVYRDARAFLSEQLGLEPGAELQQLERAILLHDPTLDRTSPDSPDVARAPRVVTCPYKGLAHFDAADTEFFHGREKDVEEVIAKLTEAGFVGLVGASGSGKSSLLRAGVLPALAAGALPGSEQWRSCLVRPGEHPMRALRESLGGEAATVIRGLAEGVRIVIAVDQLEEVFTACSDESERRAFLATLASTATAAERGVAIVVALRADFYGRCAAYRTLSGLLSTNHVLVGPMDAAELTRAIQQPAARAGLRVDPALVEALMADLGDEPGGLPLLSTTLVEVWRQRYGRDLPLSAYERSGGIRGAVARLAERAYAELDTGERKLAQTIMLRLASGDDPPVRRRVSLKEFDLETDHATAHVLEVLTGARLLSSSDDDVEVAHEALFSEWPRLRSWLDDDRTGRRLRVHLAGAASEWDAGGRDQAELYRGARLTAALDWAREHGGQLNELETGFLRAGREETTRDQLRSRRQNRRLRILLTVLAALFGVAVAAGVIAVRQQQASQQAARVALARELGAEAATEPRIDLAMLLAREAVNLDPSIATESSLLSTLLRSPAAVATFALPIDARPQSVTVVPGGRALAVNDNLGEVRFLDVGTRREAASPLKGVAPGFPTLYSRDGSMMATMNLVSGVPEIVLRSARTRAQIRALTFSAPSLRLPIGVNQPFAMAPDGGTALFGYDVLTRGRDGPAYLVRWDTTTARRSTVAVGSNGILDAAYVDGGTRIVTVTRTEITTWDARTLKRLSTVSTGSVTPTPVFAAVSPDGRTVAYAATTGSVTFVNARTGRAKPSGGGGHSAGVISLTFSPDGRTIASTGDDGLVILWQSTTGRELETFTGHAGRVTSAAFSSDGQTLYSASLDGVLFEWDLSGHRRFGRPFQTRSATRLPPYTPSTPPLALAPDGSTYAVRSGRDHVSLYSARTAQLVRRFMVGHAVGAISAIAWSPRGDVIAVGGQAGAMMLFSASGAPRAPARLPGLDGTIQSIAYSPDGVLLAATDAVSRDPAGIKPAGGQLAVWSTHSLSTPPRIVNLGQEAHAVAFAHNAPLMAVSLDRGQVAVTNVQTLRTLRQLHPIGAPNPVPSVAFAPDDTLITGSWAGIVQRWNPETGAQHGHALLAASAPIASISYSPDGQTFATTGGSDGQAKLWSTSTLQQFGATLPGDPGHWGSIAYADGGGTLVLVFDDGHGSVWPAALAAWKTHACLVASRNLTIEEWHRLVPNEPHSAICPNPTSPPA